jgi:hypothetical protein
VKKSAVFSFYAGKVTGEKLDKEYSFTDFSDEDTEQAFEYYRLNKLLGKEVFKIIKPFFTFCFSLSTFLNFVVK